MTRAQVAFLLALVDAVNGCPWTHTPPERLGDDAVYLMSLDGGPKIYITRKNRQTWTVSAGGYAFHGRDLAACYYLMGMATHMGEYNRSLLQTPGAFWDAAAQTAKNIAECKP